MKRLWIFSVFAMAMVLAPPGIAAQAKPEAAPASTHALRARVFQIAHRSPRALVPVLQPLTSGQEGAVITSSEDLRTISVRDLPENIEAIEAAIRLLDKPETSSPRAALEVQISLIAASQEPGGEEQPVPPALAPVFEQLRRTLNFKHYRYITTLSQRTQDMGRLGASGVIPNLFPIRSTQDRPGQYEYNLRGMRVIPAAAGPATILVEDFEFAVMLPMVVNMKEVSIGIQSPKLEPQRLSLATGLTLREGEQVVVGTSNAGTGEKAVIVVLSVRRTG